MSQDPTVCQTPSHNNRHPPRSTPTPQHKAADRVVLAEGAHQKRRARR
jgi:hypothetical protein